MAAPIIAALRQRRDLKESVLHTAIEIAHQASIYGVTRPLAYTWIADKSRCSSRTAIRHVHILEETAKILAPIRQKRIVRRIDLPPSDRGYTDDPRRAHERVIRHETNKYRFVIQWDKSPQRPSSSTRPCDKTSQNLPPTEREKEGSVREDVEKQKKMLRWGLYTPGTDQWRKTEEEIARLETLLAREGRYEQEISLSSPSPSSDRVCLQCGHVESSAGTSWLA